jgi:hypothetical protein
MAFRLTANSGTRLAIDSGSRSTVIPIWTPSELSTVGWYDAADADTITESGGAVSQWNDKSGNDYHMIQGSAGLQPETGLKTQNGLNVLDFVSDTLRRVSDGMPQLPNDATWIGVWKYTSGLYWWGNWGPRNLVAVGSGAYQFRTNGENLISTVSADTGNFHLITIEKDQAVNDDVYFSRNGGADEDTVAGVNLTTSTSDNGPYIGSYDGANTITGEYAEIVILDSIPTLADRQKIEGYLAWKWGLESKLPSDHPYRWDGSLFGYEALWTPTEITTAAWYDASDADTITKNEFDSVSAWADKSGNDRHATQGTGSQQPTYSTWQGLPAVQIVRTGASGDVLPTAANIIGTTDDFTIVSVLTSNISRGADSSGAGWSISNSDTGGSIVLTSGGATQYNATTTAGNLVVLQLDQNDTQKLRAWTNGQNFVETSAPKTDLRTSTKYFQLGTSNGISTAGYIGEVLVFTSAINTELRQRIEGYLAWKWGLKSNLPSDHPYKNSRPVS